MNSEMKTDAGSSRIRYLLLALMLSLLVVAVGYTFGMPILGLSGGEAPEHRNTPVGKVYRTPPSLSPIWYRGADGYEKAKQERETFQVPLIVYFYTDWCGYCRQLDRDILATEEVSQFMATVAKVRINPEAGADEHTLAQQYGVTGYPSIFVIPPDKDTRQRINPFMPAGDGWVVLQPDQFVVLCKAAGSR